MKPDKIKILYVDDEVHSLNSFKANFRKSFEIYIAESASEGLKILQSKKIHVIITDQRMPDVTGIEFLESIILDYPAPIRVFLTGFDDINAAVQAINKGQVFRYITKPWDAGELKKTIEDAYELYATRQRVDQEKNTFVYKVSHDLRGPIASIGGLISVAKEEGNDHIPKNYLNLIGDRVEHLDDLLKELLAFVTPEGKPSSIASIDFKVLVKEILVSHDHIIDFSDMEFKVNIFQKGSFFCDKGVLRSILQNLIVNAIKFRKADTTGSYVSIDIISSATEAIIEIEDNGMGMSDKIINKIFKVFYRANENSKGSGLGLYIVKSGLEKVKGKIKVQSNPGQGTIFTINIPNSKLSSLNENHDISNKGLSS